MEPGTTFLFDEASLTVTEAIQRGGFGAVFGAEVLGCPGAPDGFAIAVKHLTRRPKELCAYRSGVDVLPRLHEKEVKRAAKDCLSKVAPS